MMSKQSKYNPEWDVKANKLKGSDIDLEDLKKSIAQKKVVLSNDKGITK